MFANTINKGWNSPTITQWAVLSVTLGRTLLLLPLLLVILAPPELALWLLFATIWALTQLADFGFTATFSRLVAFVMGGSRDLKSLSLGKPKGRKATDPDWALMARVYGTAGAIFGVMVGVAFGVLAVFGSLALKAPIEKLDDPQTGWIAWGITLAGSFLSFYGGRYACILTGMDYVALANRWKAVFGVAQVALTAVIALMGGGLIALTIPNAVFGLLTIVRLRYLLGRVEEGRFREFRGVLFDRPVWDVAWGPAWRTAIGQFANIGTVQVSGLIYAQLSESLELVSYLLALRVMTLLAQFSQAPFYSRLPKMARLRAEGDIKGLASYSGRQINSVLLLFTAGVVAATFGADWALGLIGSEARFVDVELWIFMSLVWLLERHHGVHAQIYVTLNKVPFYIPNIIAAVMNLAISISLVRTLGVWALPLGQGLANLMIKNWWNVYMSWSSLGEYAWLNLKKYAPSVLVAVVAFAAMFLYGATRG